MRGMEFTIGAIFSLVLVLIIGGAIVYMVSVSSEAATEQFGHIKNLFFRVDECKDAWVCWDTEHNDVLGGYPGNKGLEACEKMCVGAYKDKYPTVLDCVSAGECECRCQEVQGWS